MAREDNTILIEDAKLIFLNFRGREGDYNREGDRNFCVLLDPKVATELEKAGYNVKTTKEREIDGETVGNEPYLQIKVGYKVRPPRVVTIGRVSGNRTELNEGLIGILDDLEFVNVDIMFRPYNYNINGREGISAYLHTAYVTFEENYLDLKYSGALDE